MILKITQQQSAYHLILQEVKQNHEELREIKKNEL